MNKFTLEQYYNEGNLRDNILKRAGIQDKEAYLNPSKSFLQSPHNYTMMARSASILDVHVVAGSKIGILVDCDVDGYTSAAIIYKMLREFHTNEIVVFHQIGKEHGLERNEAIMNKILNSGIGILIVPDAGSNDHEEIKTLSENGIETIVIDHHIIEDGSKISGLTDYVINNQRSDNKNPNIHLTGAGMALKFAEVYHEFLGFEYDHVKYYDLAAIGQIGDMSDLTDPEVRYIVFHGLENIQSSLFKTIINDRVQGITLDKNDKLAPIDIAFNVAPLLNAVTRIGTQEEKEMLFNSMVNDYDTEDYFVERRRKIRGKFKTVTLKWTLYEYVMDIITKVKARQDNLVRKLEEDIYKEIDDDGGIAVSIIDNPDKDEKAVTGLVANRVASNLEKPTLIFRDMEGKDYLTGSLRGYETVIDSLKDWCIDTGLFNFARGHSNAAGTSIDKNVIGKLLEDTKNVKVDRVIDTNIKVDLLEYYVDESRVQYGHRLRYLTNHQVENILYGYSNIRINTDFVRSRGSLTTIWEQGVEFIIFNDNKKVYDKLKSQEEKFIYIDVVGKPNINYWSNRGKTQIIVENIQISN